MGIHRKFSGTLTRTSATVSGTEVVTGVGGKPKMVLFSSLDDADDNIYSDGWDDGSIVSCNFINNLSLLATLLTVAGKSHASSILVANIAGNGHSALISDLGVDGFTLNWTRLGTGRNITVKYIAIL